MYLSIVVNCDNRPENSLAEHTFHGCVSPDFLNDGIINKIKFLAGFEKEIIVYIDDHGNGISNNVLFQTGIDTICVRTHTNEHLFNDNNYLRALQLATGDYIMHFDQDTAAFCPNENAINGMIELLQYYDYVSYPSHWYPFPVHDDSFDHVWCSTRFFMCKRETLDFAEIRRCLDDYEYWCKEYPVNRKCHWLEHILGSISKYKGKGVIYPPINSKDCSIFSWGNYKKGTLNMLNKMKYEDVVNWIAEQGGINYPVDVTIK